MSATATDAIFPAPKHNDDMALSVGGMSSPSSPSTTSSSSVTTPNNGCYDELIIVEQDTPPFSRSSALSSSRSSNSSSAKNNRNDQLSVRVEEANELKTSCLEPSQQDLSVKYENHASIVNATLVTQLQDQHKEYLSSSPLRCEDHVIYGCTGGGGRSSATQSRFSSKIRHGFMKILKRRTRSGDRLDNDDEMVITAFNDEGSRRIRDLSADRGLVCAANHDGIKTIKTVLSTNSLHYVSSSPENCRVTSFARHPATEYEELPQRNDASSVKSSSFKNVGTRLFRRRSSGALANRMRKNLSIRCSENNSEMALHQIPTIPLPSPPSCNGVSKDERRIDGDYENYNGNGSNNDLYDPLFSFVEITPLRRPSVTKKNSDSQSE